jgi:hypothetical protein
MAEIKRLLGKGKIRPATLKLNSSACRAEQTGNKPKQGGFARAVRAGYEQCFARPNDKAHVPEDFAPPSHAGETGRSDPHQATILGMRFSPLPGGWRERFRD